MKILREGDNDRNGRIKCIYTLQVFVLGKRREKLLTKTIINDITGKSKTFLTWETNQISRQNKLTILKKKNQWKQKIHMEATFN